MYFKKASRNIHLYFLLIKFFIENFIKISLLLNLTNLEKFKINL